MADTTAPFWRIKWDDEYYYWYGISSMTAGRLRAWKGFFGEDYGKANAVNQLFLQGDVDAVACVIWALLKERAEKEPGFRFPDRPQMLHDFSVGDLVNEMYTDLLTRNAQDDEGDESDPTEEVIMTSDSTLTLTSSEESGLDPVVSSARSRRRSSTE